MCGHRRLNATGDWRGEVDIHVMKSASFVPSANFIRMIKGGEISGGMQHIWGRGENTDLITSREETV